MSIPVPIPDLGAQLEHRTSAFVITTSPDGRPHVAHQPVSWQADTNSLTFPAGQSTRRNLETNALICLLFPALDESSDGYSLIVDATCEPDPLKDEGRNDLSAVPTHAVLHRPAPPQS